MKKLIFMLPVLLISTYTSAQQWSQWLNRDGPSGDGDYETMANFPANQVCGGATPVDIEARYNVGNGLVTIKPGQNAPNYLRGFAPHIGLVCINSDQPGRNLPGCVDYQVRFACGTREDLSIKYPGLQQIDAQNAEYSKTAPTFIGRYSVNVPRTVQPTVGATTPNTRTTGDADEIEIVEGVFQLGQGYDAISNIYRNPCLNQTHPDFKIISNPSGIGSTFSVSHIQSTAELYDALDINQSYSASATVNANGAEIEGGVEATNKMVSSKYLNSSLEIFVAKYTTYRKKYTLVTQPRPIKQGIVDLLIRQNDESYKRDFFKECGSSFADSVDLGASLYVIFSYDKKSLKTSEVNEAYSKVDAGVKGVFSGSTSETKKKEITGHFTKYSVSIEAVTFGGADIAHKFNNGDITKFSEYLEEFVNGVNDNTLRALNVTHREYSLPAEYASASYHSVFSNIRDYATHTQKYASLINEYVSRCTTINSYNEKLGAGFNLKNCSNKAGLEDLQKGRDDCSLSNRWDFCIHPRDYRLDNNANLIENLGLNVPSLDFISRSSSVREKSSKVGDGSRCVSETARVCLPAGCFEDKPKTWNNEGFNYVELAYSSPSGDGYKNSGGVSTQFDRLSNSHRRCAEYSVQACRKKVGSAGAFYKFYLDIHGVCPISKPFPLE